LLDDGLMLARVALPFVDDLAQVHPVVQHLVDGLLGEGLATLGDHTFCAVGLGHQRGRANRHEVVEDATHQSGLDLVDDQQTVIQVIAQRQWPAHPHPFGFAGRDHRQALQAGVEGGGLGAHGWLLLIGDIPIHALNDQEAKLSGQQTPQMG
jgi:hypothetical protein